MNKCTCKITWNIEHGCNQIYWNGLWSQSIADQYFYSWSIILADGIE